MGQGVIPHSALPDVNASPIPKPAGRRPEGSQAVSLGCLILSFVHLLAGPLPHHPGRVPVGQDVPGFSTESPASQETPLSQGDQDGCSLTLQVAQPPDTTRNLDREEWAVKSPPHTHLAPFPPPRRGKQIATCVWPPSPPSGARATRLPPGQQNKGRAGQEAEDKGRPRDWQCGKGSAPRQTRVPEAFASRGTLTLRLFRPQRPHL